MPAPDPGLYEITDAELAGAIARTPADEFVIWTGGTYDNRNSLRFNAISKAVTQPGLPVSVRDVLAHAARRDGMRGHRPNAVRQGINFHQGSQPAVYIWVRLGADGVYRTMRHAPRIDGVGCDIQAGTAIDPARFRAGVV